MKSEAAGEHTFHVEVLNISQFGFWLLIDRQEHFLPYDAFPWFRNARIAEILDVKRSSHDHFFWPALDIDLELDCIVNPQQYPLVYRNAG
jgi:hypothetical protein